MIKRIALLASFISFLTVSAFAQGPVGGTTAPPPFPNQAGTQLFGDPGFESDAIGSTPASPWVVLASCVTVASVNDNAVTGSGSTRSAGAGALTTCPVASTTLFEQTKAIGASGTHEAVKMTGWMHYTANPACTLTTTAASLTSNVVTLTFSSNPTLCVAQFGQIKVSGFTGADTYFNGQFAISSGGVTSTTVQYSLTHANGTATTTGTLQGIPAISMDVFDITHGTTTSLWSFAREWPSDNLFLYPMGSTTNDWVPFSVEFFITPDMHAGDSIELRIIESGAATGTTYFDDFAMNEEWYPLRNFLLSPNSAHGYEWTDLAPNARTLTSSYGTNYAIATKTFCASPVPGMVCGVAEIDPPAGQTLATSTLLEKIATSSDCSTGVLATKTFASPAATQAWAFIPSDYGGIPATGTKDYVCASLTSGAPAVTYPSFAVVFEGATFRNALQNYIAPDGSVVHNGKTVFINGTYDRCSTERCYGGTGGGIFRAGTDCGLSTAVNCYTYKLGGNMDSSRVAPQTQFATGDAQFATASTKAIAFADYSAAHFNNILNFVNWSAINPTGSPEQYTPLEQALGNFNLMGSQITNNWYGFAVNQTNVAAAPAFAPTITAGSGFITAATLFVKVAAVIWPIPDGSGGSSGAEQGNQTLPSTASSISLSGAACAGVNCSASFAVPTCPNARYAGFNVFTSTDNVTYTQQFPNVAGQFSQAGPVPCGATVSLSVLQTNGIAPPTADISWDDNRPSWIGSTTDSVAWANLAGNGSTTAGTQNPSFPVFTSFYVADEPRPTAINTVWYQAQTLMSNANGILIWCTLYNATAIQIWRDVCDVVNNDPYGYGLAANNDEYAADPAHTTNSCPVYSGDPNIITSQIDCFPYRVNQWANEIGRYTYGSRPAWMTYQNFSRGTFWAAPYAELRRQQLEAIIGVQNYGSIGAGLMMWMEGYSSGIEQRVYVGQSFNPELDVYHANSDLAQLVPILLTPVEDSPVLGLGKVISAVSNGTTAATDCGAASIFTNATNYPEGQARFVTHTDPATGDEYIFAVHLCGGSDAVTFSLPNIPVGQTSVDVLYEGRTLPITSSQFVDTMGAYQTSIYVIRTPRGATIQ